MKNNPMRWIAAFFLLVYLAMQLLCILPNDNRRQIVFFMWFICSYSAYTPVVSKTLRMKETVPLYIFCLFYGVTMMYRHDVVYSVSAVLSMFELFSPFLMYRILRIETSFMRRIVFLAITAIVIANVTVCYIYMNFSITHYGLRDIEEFMEYKNTFFLVYSVAILVPFIIYYLSHQEKTKKKWFKNFKTLIALGACLILILFILQAQFMTAIVLMLTGGVLAFVYKRRGALVAVPIAAALVLGLFSAFSDDLIRIADNNDATAVSSRIEELQHILSNNAENADDYSIRQDKSQSSLQTFIENPIIGVFYKYKDMNEAKHYGIGNHAEWLDTLAKYGLFGILLFVFIYKAIKKQRLAVGTNIHYILFGVLGFLNPVLGFYLVCSVFLYMPLLNKVYFDN